MNNNFVRRVGAASILLCALAACGDAASGGPSGNGLEGTYFLVDGYGNHRHRTFLPGDLLYSGVPAGGPEVFGAEQARAGDPRELGTYTLSGDTITIEWGGDSPVEVKTFAREEGNVVLDGYTYRALPRYPDGHRLEGRFTTRSYNSMGVAGGGSMAWSGASTIVFHPDGTFDYGRAGSATTTSGASAAGSERSAGRYAIEGNTITFTFDDGSLQHALIHPWSGEESATRPESLNLAGNTYVQEG